MSMVRQQDRDRGSGSRYSDLLWELTTLDRDEIPAALGALAEADAHLRLRLGAAPALPAAEPDRLLTVSVPSSAGWPC